MPTLKPLNKFCTDHPGLAVFIAVLVIIGLISCLAQAQERKYAAPDITEYLESLKQPDSPSVSCCGPGDKYFAERTEACTDADIAAMPSCKLVAIITDTGPDNFTVPDGKGGLKQINRPHIPVGTRIPIPASKIRKHPSANPTDKNIIFTGTSLWPYCWEPATLI